MRGERLKGGGRGVGLYAFEAVGVGAEAQRLFRYAKVPHRAEQSIPPFVDEEVREEVRKEAAEQPLTLKRRS